MCFAVPGHCSSILDLTRVHALASVIVSNHVASIGLGFANLALDQGWN